MNMVVPPDIDVAKVIAVADDLLVPYTEGMDGTCVINDIANADSCGAGSLVFVETEAMARVLLESCPALLITTGALADLIISSHASPDDLNIAITAHPRDCKALVCGHLEDLGTVGSG